MPRSFAMTPCSIWDDESFLALGADVQGCYLMLQSQREISACGLLPLTLRRWAKMTTHGDPRRLVALLNALSDAGWIAIDKDTEELLVPRFAEDDGGLKHAGRRKAVVGSAGSIRSTRLRGLMVAELDRLGIPHGIEVPVDTDPTDPTPPSDKQADPTGDAIESLSSGSRVAIESLSSATPVAVESIRVGLSKSVPEATHNPHPQPGEGTHPTATRLPDPWCTRHPQGTDAPCARCARARAAHDQARAALDAEAKADKLAARRAEREARALAIHACQLCNDNGYRLTPEGKPGAVCNHHPLNPGGRDRAFAEISGGNL